MRIFKFNTKISSNGTIQIPYTPSLFDKEVGLIIVPKSEKNVKINSARNFVNKWAGFLKNDNTDLLKNSYLSEKYK